MASGIDGAFALGHSPGCYQRFLSAGIALILTVTIMLGTSVK
jgi:hypothetical protein